MAAFAEPLTQHITAPSAPRPGGKPSHSRKNHPSAPAPVEPQAGAGIPALTADSPVTEEAAESVIADRRIGERIKYLRQRKQMGLVELGRYTGLSASFLSQLETGRVVPTLRNLARIAMVFSKDLSYFFEPERPELFRILRAGNRQRLPQTGVEEPGYFYESLGHIPPDHSIAQSIAQPIAPYVAEFLRRPASSPASSPAERPAGAAEDLVPSEAPLRAHDGREFLFMLSGRLQLAHDAAIDILEEGDAVYFDASAPHRYERLGDEPCTALILTLPESLRGSHTGSRIPFSRPAEKKR